MNWSTQSTKLNNHETFYVNFSETNNFSYSKNYTKILYIVCNSYRMLNVNYHCHAN